MNVVHCLRTRLFLGVGLALAGALPALAQTSQADGDAQEDGVRTLGNVTVSASRIDRPGFVSPTPTMRIAPEELDVVARPNVAAALNDMPQFRATTSAQTTGTNTSAGQAPVDLRGLGTSRTLVLLDGRRFVSDNDLNTVPTIMIRDVDVVTGGASAAWGSGAVGGVVNIAIDEALEGIKFDLHGGESSYDDAEQRALGFAFGTAFGGGRGHLVVGAEYSDHEGIIPKTSRPNVGRWAQVSNGDGSYTTVADVGFSNAAYGGLIMSGVLKGKAFNPDGSLRDFDYGTVVGTSMIGGEGPSADDLSPLMTPQTRWAGLARATWWLDDDLKLTAEYRQSRVANDYVYVGDDNRGNLAIGIDNAFLPEEVRQALLSAGETGFTMGRFNTADFANSRMDFERVARQATLALDGGFGETWRWSAFYSYGEHENNLNVPYRILTEQYANAVDSVIDPTTGNPVCRIALTDPATDCVPIDLFGLGAPSEAATAYVTGTPRSRAKTVMHLAGADLRGEPFELPAGPVSVAVGIDARRESVRQTVDALSAANAFTRWNPSAMSGEYTVTEGFLETVVPVLDGVPFFQRLEFNGAARLSHYDTTGSIWSWKLGLTNEFVEGVRARFTRSRDIRSANLTELYTQTTTGYNNITDPFTNTTVYALTNGGGNPNLVPEEADTTTFGFAWSPTSVPGLDMSIDYFDIDIANVITSVSAQDIVTRCYNGNAEMCGRVTRDASGNISRIVSSYANLSRYQTNGIDVEAAYLLPLGRVSSLPGALNFRLLGTWVDSLTTDDGVSRIEYVTSQGYSFGLGTPRWRGVASIGYQNGRFGADFRARYISAGNYNTTINITNNRIPSYVYYDLGVKYRLSDDAGPEIELYANAANLFDKDPPVGSLYSPYYDVLGRYVTLGARVRF
ncbi:TonB-dependent receptor domain-containing protein [Luteimonas huabeiensis]|uniref:TonB-dependent receptor domain-containing protein n=1 Tax=Luteimonas huabeiensis TaxID=1244513 RepID=UPI0004657394|nr:TonB-dependent receptor [Luteimonas huabeiensis]